MNCQILCIGREKEKYFNTSSAETFTQTAEGFFFFFFLFILTGPSISNRKGI